MDAQEFLAELAGKRLFATPEEKRQLIADLSEATGLLPYPVPIILVTGTCGKGSTSAFLSAILEANGYRVGSIQSPHLVSFSERLQIDRQPLAEAKILAQVDALLPAFLATAKGTEQHRFGALNYNQVFLVAGLHLFAQERVDFAIVETGIGGYNDPSSYFTPILSVITNVHKDHESVLGPTYDAIAYDKSGFIKNGRPAVTGTRIPEALAVLKREAVAKVAPLFCLDEDFSVVKRDDSTVYVDGPLQMPFDLRVLGDFQVQNAALAIKASLLLQDIGYAIDEEKSRQGLRATVLPGRLQVVARQPLTVVDGAHNEEELRQFAETLHALPCRKHFVILGFSGDKQVDEMLKWLDALDCVYLFAPHSNVLRTLSSAELAERYRSADRDCHFFESMAEAYAFASSQATAEDGIFFTGSMFVAGDALKLF